MRAHTLAWAVGRACFVARGPSELVCARCLQPSPRRRVFHPRAPALYNVVECTWARSPHLGWRACAGALEQPPWQCSCAFVNALASLRVRNCRRVRSLSCGPGAARRSPASSSSGCQGDSGMHIFSSLFPILNGAGLEHLQRPFHPPCLVVQRVPDYLPSPFASSST